MFKETYTKENLYIGEHKNCHNSFNIKWILAQLGRHMRLTKANDSPKFQTDTLKTKKLWLLIFEILLWFDRQEPP